MMTPSPKCLQTLKIKVETNNVQIFSFVAHSSNKLRGKGGWSEGGKFAHQRPTSAVKPSHSKLDKDFLRSFWKPLPIQLHQKRVRLANIVLTKICLLAAVETYYSTIIH